MAKPKVSFTIKAGELQRAISRLQKRAGTRTAEAVANVSTSEIRNVGQTVVDEMKSRIARGQSPIQGNGRFPRYKNPSKYPGNKKPHRPVNLELTGQFLNSLQPTANARLANPLQRSVRIGFTNTLARKKEQGHREGVNGQPSRPIIPDQNAGERLLARIRLRAQNEYLGILRKRLRQLGLIK